MKLSLKTERLAELTTEDLHAVAGGQQIPTVAHLCASLRGDCPSWRYCTTAITCGCPPTYTCA